MSKNALKRPAKEYRLLLYGPKGVGRRSLALGLVPGSLEIGVGLGDVKVKDWTQLRAALTKAVNAKKLHVTLVDVEGTYQACRTHVLQANNFRAESDGEMGLGWELVRKEWTLFVHLLLRLPGFILFSGAAHKEIVTIQRHYHRLEPDVTPRALTAVTPHLDLIASVEHWTNDDGVTSGVIQVQGREDRLASSWGSAVPLDPKSLLQHLHDNE